MVDSANRPAQRTPRWVKGFGVVALILVAGFLGVHLAGGGMGHFGAHLRGDVTHHGH